ncbi:ENTH/ANTH/VHS superfamily protein [Cocos nucifera]|uniref:ENTH/ANTH/VHS superfamily protein n=1 Tax=Cocos nucifera TaxID=13894 RepID=A0A8K0MVY7_COCNU|nr:ENTH/ANTH/VHS superfamily protein [Cocos nucifera]
MAPSSIRKALGAVKDKTSIGLAKVSNTSTVSDLDVAIVKATRHNEFPAEEKHIREILSLTCYSRAYVSACVSTLARRLGKTKSWTVALKTLILVHRLLCDGDPAYEHEIYSATRRGMRMLNMSDFRDTSRSDAWDFSAFVRTYALYLDERLEYRVHGRRKRRRSRSSICTDEEEEEAAVVDAAAARATPVREMKTDRLFIRTQRLQQLMERVLACRPTGAAKNNRIVHVALYPLVKESFQIYYDLAEIMNIFIDRFMELEVPECVRVHGIFSRLAKQFEDLEVFYGWCKAVGMCRSSEYPEIERITTKKLDVMDDFIRDKSRLADSKKNRDFEPEPEEPDDDISNIKALPAPEDYSSDPPAEQKEELQEERNQPSPPGVEQLKEEEKEEVDLLNLKDDAMTGEDHGNSLALALFDGNTASNTEPKWEAFPDADSCDWETALVQSASNLSGQKATLGGGLDMLLLDGMYAQAHTSAAAAAHAQGYGGGGSASSVAIRAPAMQPMLALPAPPTSGGTNIFGGDPFTASLMVPPPSYVQMSDMEKKQHLLSGERQMWEQYARDGMQGQLGPAKLQQASWGYQMGGYDHNQMF